MLPQRALMLANWMAVRVDNHTPPDLRAMIRPSRAYLASVSYGILAALASAVNDSSGSWKASTLSASKANKRPSGVLHHTCSPSANSTNKSGVSARKSSVYPPSCVRAIVSRIVFVIIYLPFTLGQFLISDSVTGLPVEPFFPIRSQMFFSSFTVNPFIFAISLLFVILYYVLIIFHNSVLVKTSGRAIYSTCANKVTYIKAAQ